MRKHANVIAGLCVGICMLMIPAEDCLCCTVAMMVLIACMWDFVAILTEIHKINNQVSSYCGSKGIHAPSLAALTILANTTSCSLRSQQSGRISQRPRLSSNLLEA